MHKRLEEIVFEYIDSEMSFGLEQEQVSRDFLMALLVANRLTGRKPLVIHSMLKRQWSDVLSHQAEEICDLLYARPIRFNKARVMTFVHRHVMLKGLDVRCSYGDEGLISKMVRNLHCDEGVDLIADHPDVIPELDKQCTKLEQSDTSEFNAAIELAGTDPRQLHLFYGSYHQAVINSPVMADRTKVAHHVFNTINTELRAVCKENARICMFMYVDHNQLDIDLSEHSMSEYVHGITVTSPSVALSVLGHWTAMSNRIKALGDEKYAITGH